MRTSVAAVVASQSESAIFLDLQLDSERAAHLSSARMNRRIALRRAELWQKRTELQLEFTEVALEERRRFSAWLNLQWTRWYKTVTLAWLREAKKYD